MSNVRQFPEVPPSKPEQFSSPQAEGVAGAIWTLFNQLPLADQQALVARLTKAAQLIPASRAGDVLGTVARFLPKRRQWTADQIRGEVSAAGVQATSRDVFNAIGYLAKKGLVERMGAGRYRVAGAGMVTSDEFYAPGDPNKDRGSSYD